MITYSSFPHLSNSNASALVSRAINKDLKELSEQVIYDHPKCTFSESGYPMATEAELRALRTEVVQLAYEFDFPEPMGRRASVFDQRLAPIIYKHVNSTPAEARDHAIWNFITCCLLIDISLWRFPNLASNPTFPRMVGNKTKNTFARLWWRTYVLGPHSTIGEDEAVALLERTTLSGDSELATMIVDHFSRYFNPEKHGSRSECFRVVSKYTRLQAAKVCYSALSSEQKSAAVKRAVISALHSISAKARR